MTNRGENLRIILSGGGTGGAITPPFALAGDKIKKIECRKISFKAIHSGKLRRYFDFRNFIDPFFIIFGFFESLWIIYKFKPNMIITAGGFVAVPVVWAGWILRVP